MKLTCRLDFITMKCISARMKSRFDIILVLPYPFSDHPSFPEGLLAGALRSNGFRVGILDAIRWQDPDEFTRLGRPELFFAIVPGPVDSVIMNYTPVLKRRREDLYQADGSAFFPDSQRAVASRVRPDRCVITLANQIRKAWKDVRVIAGGMETGQRIFAHYDFLQQRIRRSVILDARLDLAVTGMGEIQICAAARAAAGRNNLRETGIPGTAVVSSNRPDNENFEELPGLEEIENDPSLLLTAYKILNRADAVGKGVFQRQNERWIVRQPQAKYTPEDLDTAYSREYTRTHPNNHCMSPALKMNLFSITSHRGCVGRCAFCAVCHHQGDKVISRSPESICREVDQLSRHPRWRGVISDVGGATAEMYGMDMPALDSGPPYLQLLRRIRRHPQVRKVFVASGVRHDLMLKWPELLEEIMRHHSGRFLRVAPEHIDDDVLRCMGKPRFSLFRDFCSLFAEINRGLRRRVELAAYVIVGHPGEEEKHIKDMASLLRNLGVSRVDAQIFTPAPGLLSTAMYMAGMDAGGRNIPVCRDTRELEKRKNTLYIRGRSHSFS
ncbi:MAG: radical SAM protein [Candidatus Aminicenantes bacterium]|nr:radical SAM protein [Candidatus Aminicenantes bacterium]